MTSSAAPVSSRVVMVGGLVWLAGALAVGATGAFAAMPFPVPQIIVFVLTVMAITVSVSVAGVRVWVDSV